MEHKVITAGVGGKGGLLAGMLLAEAGTRFYKDVLWFPSYSAMMRGGPCECSVILSDDEIDSPAIDKTPSLIVMEPSQVPAFEERVEERGVFIVEEEGFKGTRREDVKVFRVPAVKKALEIGDARSANLVLLGVYVTIEEPVPPSAIREALERRFWGRWMLFDMNKKAFEEGMEMGKELKSSL